MTKKSRSRLSSEATQRAVRGFSRRTLLKGAAAAGAVAVAPAIISRDALSSSGELNLMNWSDYMPAPYKEKFEKQTGITVKHTPYGSNEELLNKIKATKGRGFDIIGPTVDRVNQWKELNVLQPWDMTRVPTDKITPGLLKGSSDAWTYEGGNHHLPYTWGTEALSWRTDKWSSGYEDLSYGDLWSEEMKGKIMGRPHSMLLTIGLWMDGTGDLPSNRMLDAFKDEDNMRRIWDHITKYAIENKAQIKQFWNDADAQINGFMQNDVVLGQTWDGPPLRLKKEGEPVTYMAPQEGALTWLDGLSMPVGAKNIDQAYEFINFIYEPDNNGMFADLSGYNPVAVGASDHLSDAAKKNFQEAYPGDALDRLWWWPPSPSWYTDIRPEYVDKFVAA